MSPRLRIAFKRSYNAQRSISLSSPVSQKPKIKDKEQESLSSENNGEIEEEKPKKQMTLAERDAELMRKLEEIAGEGGASGGTHLVYLPIDA